MGGREGRREGVKRTEEKKYCWRDIINIVISRSWVAIGWYLSISNFILFADSAFYHHILA